MFVKIALGNAKKAIKDYLIYFITITLCVSLFYAFTSLSSSSYELITEESLNFEMLKQVLKYATYIITALLAILIAYVTRYIMKRRQREFATYILLGMEQKSVALMFFIETLIIGIISIILGIFIGTLFSQGVTAIVCASAKQEIVFTFKLYMDTVGWTFLFFILMFCIIGLFNVRTFKKAKLIEMLNDEKKTEFQFKRSSKVYKIIFIISIILYSTCSYCTIKLTQIVNEGVTLDLDKATYIGVALITFILGTYTMFYAISYIIILIKERCMNFKYEYTNLFLIGTIVSKIKTAPILMGTIAITFLGAALSFTLTLIMAQWALGFLDYRVPFDISITNDNRIISDIKDIKDIPKMDYSEVINYIKGDEDNIKEYCQLESYFINEEDFYKRTKGNMPIVAIKLSDFNELRTMLNYEKIELDNNEFTMQWEKTVDDTEVDKYIKENPVLNVNNQSIKYSKTPYYKEESMGQRIYNFYPQAFIVLPDYLCENLTLATTQLFVNTNKDISFDKAIDFRDNYIPNWFKENDKALPEKYKEASPEDDSSLEVIETQIKVVETSTILNVTLGMRILGIYLGIVLLMIGLTVLALKQLADSIEHKGRFKTLKKLGIDDKEINKIILKQISIYFIMPISVAIIGFIIFSVNIHTIMGNIVNLYMGEREFVINIVISLMIMVAIYACYFIGTYYTFKRNINNKN